MYPNIVNDGAYHVVSIERKGDRIYVPTVCITERSDQSITYTTLYVGANKDKGDIFHGAIGGLYWNGRYPIDEAKGGLQITTGDVIHVLLPSFILPGKKPVPTCPVDYCFNGGICYVEDYELKCDCRLTGWQGSRCEKPTRGVLPSTSGNGAYVIINVVPPKPTNVDRMRVAFQTYATDGPIARFMTPDGRFYEIYMVSPASPSFIDACVNLFVRLLRRILYTFSHRIEKGQQVFVSNSKDEIRLISAPYQQCDDGKMHVITLVRNGSRFDWSVDGHRTIYIDKSVFCACRESDCGGQNSHTFFSLSFHPPALVDSNGALVTNEIILGADRKFTNSFNGVLGAPLECAPPFSLCCGSMTGVIGMEK
ncbi:unnamed protein product [Hydatigera taeniaeformis]|uniref:EGF-like domain-containing protein n=1 Tax=Hydatigena taeniaeformis TaxID=6205 RepID=A0A0R3WP90_HYDTA|nr:unnamed protein product [Hydatigera taeniaeformis]